MYTDDCKRWMDGLTTTTATTLIRMYVFKKKRWTHRSHARIFLMFKKIMTGRVSARAGAAAPDADAGQRVVFCVYMCVYYTYVFMYMCVRV